METRTHAQTLDEHAHRFDVQKWFGTWRAAIGKRQEPGRTDVDHLLPLRETILEALSDASAEQFLSPLTARHLRRYGKAQFAETDLWFWARCEWGKVDICYGVAPKQGFDGGWDNAWAQGHTGDLGQIEVKVCYAHEGRGDRQEKLRALTSQLQARRDYDVKMKHLPARRTQRYHGIVWLFQHGGTSDEIATTADEIVDDCPRSLSIVESFAKKDPRDEFGKLWPAFGGADYSCHLDVALLELRD